MPATSRVPVDVRERQYDDVHVGEAVRGFPWIEQHYAPAFPRARPGSLRLQGFSARPLGTTYALVTARYVLYRNGVTTASGPFSVVLQEQTNGWKIILDHTSADPH